MNTRLKQFLSAENISQSQFADTIKVVRASVSHVLSGRNNPSYDFIKAIMNSYPSLNIEWLMLGKGKMYKEQGEETLRTSVGPIQPEPPLLFNEYFSEEDDLSLFEKEIPPLPRTSTQNTQTSNDSDTSCNTSEKVTKQRNISKIIVLFDDGSFQEM